MNQQQNIPTIEEINRLRAEGNESLKSAAILGIPGGIVAAAAVATGAPTLLMPTALLCFGSCYSAAKGFNKVTHADTLYIRRTSAQLQNNQQANVMI